MKNKKADIPVVILVLGVIAVCLLAIFSFISFNFKVGRAFAQVSVIEKLDSQISEYNFYKDHQVPDKKIAEALNVNENYLEQAGDGILASYTLP
ncbi:MAG: hypothetical protein NTW17_01630 [Candidatus Pacearchaeota archaeon]|nr:hypothetical protein [Candidatus Pacearchaeota archaeon]